MMQEVEAKIRENFEQAFENSLGENTKEEKENE